MIFTKLSSFLNNSLVVLVWLAVLPSGLVHASDADRPSNGQVVKRGGQALEWIRTVEQPEGQQHHYQLGEASVSALITRTKIPLSQRMVEHEARLLRDLLGPRAQVKEVRQLPPGPMTGHKYFAILFATRTDEPSKTNRLEISALVSLKEGHWARLRFSTLHAPDPRQTFTEALEGFAQIRELKDH